MTNPDKMAEAPRPTRSRGPTVLAVIVLVGLLVATAVVMWWAWVEIGEVEFSAHGLIALGLGIGLTLLCGVGLMALVFFSSRRGYDERAHDWSHEHGRQKRKD